MPSSPFLARRPPAGRELEPCVGVSARLVRSCTAETKSIVCHFIGRSSYLQENKRKEEKSRGITEPLGVCTAFMARDGIIHLLGAVGVESPPC